MSENQIDNPVLDEVVTPENPLKTMLIDYVGTQLKPEDGLITVEMIVEVLAKEFPEFVLAVAEENFIRGYHQALQDLESQEQQKDDKVHN